MNDETRPASVERFIQQYKSGELRVEDADEIEDVGGDTIHVYFETEDGLIVLPFDFRNPFQRPSTDSTTLVNDVMWDFELAEQNEPEERF